MRYLWLFACIFLAGTTQAQEPEKFSLTMFHFNVQYVAGGLSGYPSGTDTNPVFDLDDAQTQDMIIVESFEPILDLFLEHPGWKVTLELQAYMVEIMMERHPQILAKLQQLVDAGQAELVSFHWSDQLFLAYPRLDLQRSHEIMDRVYQQAGLAPSEVVFCQEGQFGEGMAPFAREHGRSILVLPVNLFRYQHQDLLADAPPLYELDGLDVVIGARSFATPEVEVQWSFFDDGEKLATDGADPYFVTGFIRDEAALQAYADELLALEQNGYRIASISEYVSFVKSSGLQASPLPAMLDGTWQPPSTDSMRRWMGGAGLLDGIYQVERDNLVLTGNVQARHWILVAETLVEHADKHDDYADRLENCWREVLLAQVSDASGINPFYNEIHYGLDHGRAGLQCADSIIGELAPEIGGPYLQVLTSTGQVNEIDDRPSELSVPADPYFTDTEGFKAESPGRTIQTDWFEVGEQGNLHRVTIQASKPEDQLDRSLEVTFPLNLDGLYLTPGLVETEVVYTPLSQFSFLEGKISIPAANGLIGIDEGLWLIKQTSSVHVAATFFFGDGLVHFFDDTLDPDSPASWTFWILEGDGQEAVELADRLNLRPAAYIETGVRSDRGCGCGQSSGSLSWLALLGLLPVRRRRTADPICGG